MGSRPPAASALAQCWLPVARVGSSRPRLPVQVATRRKQVPCLHPSALGPTPGLSGLSFLSCKVGSRHLPRFPMGRVRKRRARPLRENTLLPKRGRSPGVRAEPLLASIPFFGAVDTHLAAPFPGGPKVHLFLWGKAQICLPGWTGECRAPGQKPQGGVPGAGTGRPEPRTPKLLGDRPPGAHKRPLVSQDSSWVSRTWGDRWQRRAAGRVPPGQASVSPRVQAKRVRTERG